MTDSDITFAAFLKEMTRTHPNQYLDTWILLISLRPFPTSRQFGEPQNPRAKMFLSNRQSYSPRYQRAFFIQLIFSNSRHHISTWQKFVPSHTKHMRLSNLRWKKITWIWIVLFNDKYTFNSLSLFWLAGSVQWIFKIGAWDVMKLQTIQ